MSAPARSTARRLLRLVALYLVAGAVETAAFFEVVGGHAHAPFTQFPDYLVLAPLGPLVAPNLLYSEQWREGLVWLSLFAVVFFVLGWSTRSRAARPPQACPP